MAADLTAAIYTRALADAGLQALLGSGAAMRFHPVELPQKPTLPAVAWAVISEPRLYAGGGYAGLSHSRVHFECVATSHAGAVTLARAVRAAFAAFIGAGVVTSGGTVTIQSMEPQAAIDDYDQVTANYWRAFDVLFWWVDS